MTDNPFWLIVGLGNPGAKYAGNRHNIGAMVIDWIAQDAGVMLRVHKARAMIAQVRIAEELAVIAIPTTYMNESGGPVAELMDFCRVPLERLIVIHDELDIDFTKLRLKCGGYEGGHNGLCSVSKSVGSQDYLRVRVGIGRPPWKMDVSVYVLKNFNPIERKELNCLIPSAIEATELLMQRNLPDAQNIVHAG